MDMHKLILGGAKSGHQKKTNKKTLFILKNFKDTKRK